MRIYSIADDAPAFSSNEYLICSGKDAAVVDPSHGLASVLRFLGDGDFRLRYILVTHAHFDHILKIDEYVKNTGAEVIVGEKDKLALSDRRFNLYSAFLGYDGSYTGSARGVKDGDTLPLGDIIVSVYDTPGHTQGSVTYTVPGAAFTGDLMFSGGRYGRCDFPGGDYNKLCTSLAHIKKMPPDTLIYPGHGDNFRLDSYECN